MARRFSGADVVGMPSEFVYLHPNAHRAGVTVRRKHPSEVFARFVAGGTLLSPATLRQLARARRRSLGIRSDLTRLTTGFAMAVIVYLATGLFLHFAYIRYFWLMMALAAAAGRIAHQELDAEPAATPAAVPVGAGTAAAPANRAEALR